MIQREKRGEGGPLPRLSLSEESFLFAGGENAKMCCARKGGGGRNVGADFSRWQISSGAHRETTSLFLWLNGMHRSRVRGEKKRYNVAALGTVLKKRRLSTRGSGWSVGKGGGGLGVLVSSGKKGEMTLSGEGLHSH